MLDREDGATRCLPAAYVVGAWQSGGEELGERLQMALGKENVVARAPHFWNEHTETLSTSVRRWDRTAFGDASPGTLTSWSESMRFHRAHAARRRSVGRRVKSCPTRTRAKTSDAVERGRDYRGQRSVSQQTMRRRDDR